MQTGLGYLLALASVDFVPVMVGDVGWRFAFSTLAIGPFLGVWAMARLRARPGLAARGRDIVETRCRPEGARLAEADGGAVPQLPEVVPAPAAHATIDR